MVESTVNEKFCEERHKAVKEKYDVQERRLNDHSGRISAVEDAVLKLTLLVEQSKKRDIFDKLMTTCIFIMCLVLAAIVLGPEITGKMLGGVK